MVSYRFIFFSHIGRVLGEHTLLATRDSEALELGGLLGYPFAIEVMEGFRRVGSVLPATGPGAIALGPANRG